MLWGYGGPKARRGGGEAHSPDLPGSPPPCTQLQVGPQASLVGNKGGVVRSSDPTPLPETAQTLPFLLCYPVSQAKILRSSLSPSLSPSRLLFEVCPESGSPQLHPTVSPWSPASPSSTLAALCSHFCTAARETCSHITQTLPFF